MSLIDKVKSAVPLASNPEPESNLTAGDFDEMESGGNGDDGRDSEGPSSADGEQEQSGSEDGQNDDGTNESPGDGDDSHPGQDGQGGDSDSSSEGEQPGESGEGDRDGDSAGDAGDEGGEQPRGDDESAGDGDGSTGEESSDAGENGESNGESGGNGQQSLFDYEDPEDWSNPGGEDSGSDDGQSGDADDDADADGTGETGQDGQDTEGDDAGEPGDEPGDGSDGTEDGDEGEQPGEDSQDGESDGSGDTEGDGPDSDEAGEDVPDGSQEGSDSPGETDGTEDGVSDGSDGDPPGESGDSDAEDNGDAGDMPGDNGKPGQPDNGTPDNDPNEIEPDNNTPTPPGVGEDPYEPHPDLGEEERNQIQQEQRELEEQMRQAEQELEEFAKALSDNAGGGGIGEVQFNIDPDSSTTSDRWSDAVANKKRAATLLAKYLNQSRRDTWKRGRTKGSLDNKRLHAVKAKRLDIMKQRNPGNKKKYSVIVVLDRSGSMGGEKIDIAESAIAQYALAMEDLGIEVCVMDMYQNTARVISPFGVDIEMSKGDLMSNETGGGTPLSDAVEIARKRMQNSNQFPIMISVTDGRPRHPDQYKEELNKAHMPVMGITIDPGTRFNDAGPRTGSQDQYYDIHTYVNSEDELQEQLEKMTMQIPF